MMTGMTGATATSLFAELATVPQVRAYLRPLQPPTATARFEIVLRCGSRTGRALMPEDQLHGWVLSQPEPLAQRVVELLRNIAAPRPDFAGLSLRQPCLMGIVNVTPDSFSDGGLWLDVNMATEHALALSEQGAGIIDLGAESTRPGATPVSIDEEIRRLDPVIHALAGTNPALLISVDTRHAATMRHVLDLGAAIINDVSALSDDPKSIEVIAASRASVVLMHKQGQPAMMNVAPHYDDVVLDVYDYLEERVRACEMAGIARSRILVDPGIAFGKTPAHSMALLTNLSIFHGLGCGVLIGVSRKGLLGERDSLLQPRQRLPGSLAAELWALQQGVQVFRVHDVAETAYAFAVWQAIAGTSVR